MKDLKMTQEDLKKGEHLLQRERIENTPFQALSWGDGWFLALGKHLLNTEAFESKEEAYKVANGMPWEFLLNMIIAVTEELSTLKNQE